VLRRLANPTYGIVGFGGGQGISRSLPSLATIGRPIEQIDYVGDLDYPGLRIAASAAAAAATAGLPAVRPATALHIAMLASAKRFGHSDGWPDDADTAPSNTAIQNVVRFLDHQVRDTVSALLQKRHRIPEEVLGPDELVAVWQS
jgi:hypothetical protein